MKKILITVFLILICFTQVSAFGICVGSVSSRQTTTTVASCDSCAGDLSLSWHFENSDTFTVGTAPYCGCSDGASSAVLTGGSYTTTTPQSGTYSILHDFNNDNFTISVTTEDIVTDDEGTITFWLWLDSYSSGKEIIRVSADSSNFISVIMLTNTDNELRLRHRGNGTSVDSLSANCNLTTGQWYFISAKWRQGATDPSILLECDGVSETGNTTNLTNFSATITEVRGGDNGGLTFLGKMDGLKIYKTWQP